MTRTRSCGDRLSLTLHRDVTAGLEALAQEAGLRPSTIGALLLTDAVRNATTPARQPAPAALMPRP